MAKQSENPDSTAAGAKADPFTESGDRRGVGPACDFAARALEARADAPGQSARGDLARGVDFRPGHDAGCVRGPGADGLVHGPAGPGLHAARILVDLRGHGPGDGIPAIFAAMVRQERSSSTRTATSSTPTRRGRCWSRAGGSTGPAGGRRRRSRQEKERARRAAEEPRQQRQEAGRGDAGPAVRWRGPRPPWRRRFPSVLQSLAGVRKSVGLDGPQQLMDYTAPPADIRGRPWPRTIWPRPSPLPSCRDRGTGELLLAGGPPHLRSALPPPVEAELASVPEPQSPLAAMLPLAGRCRRGGPSASRATKHLETFNAENLFEKIDGRAESFLQYGVKGMAYTFYHPTGDASNEVQLYIFEMADSLKALGKYGSEKPDEVKLGPDRRPGIYVGRQHALLRGQVLHPDRLDRRTTPSSPTFALELAKRRRPPEAGAPVADARRDGSRPVATGKQAAASAISLDGRRSPRRPRPCCWLRAARASPSTSPRMSSAIASSPTSSWPITRTGTSPGRVSSGPTATPRRPRRCSRSTSRASRRTAPRSRRSRPKGPTRLSSAPTSAWLTSSSARATPWPGPTANRGRQGRGFAGRGQGLAASVPPLKTACPAKRRTAQRQPKDPEGDGSDEVTQ